MEELVGQHARLDRIKKIGEGTFGEAFKAGSMVFKIVPLDGDLLVNGEVQKTSQEIYAEATISSRVSQLRQGSGESRGRKYALGFWCFLGSLYPL